MKAQIGDKLVEADASGKIKVTAEGIHRVDVVVRIPCLQIISKNKKGI